MYWNNGARSVTYTQDTLVYIYSKYLICFRILILQFFFFVSFTISQFSNNVPLLPVSILNFDKNELFLANFIIIGYH